MVNCLYALIGEPNSHVYCLKYKEELNKCPTKCPYRDKHFPWQIKLFPYKKTCLYLQIKKIEGIAQVSCGLYNIYVPSCEKCPLSSYDSLELHFQIREGSKS